MLMENTTFYNTFVNFSLNVTKFGILIDIVETDMVFVAMETILMGNYEFLNYQNVCI